MPSAEPNAECSYDDLVRIYRENSALETAEQCRLALRALRQLYILQPSEVETSGDRLTMRDIEKRIEEAQRALTVAQLTDGSIRTPVITPTDCLR